MSAITQTNTDPCLTEVNVLRVARSRDNTCPQEANGCANS
jgi:hypothetical protein